MFYQLHMTPEQMEQLPYSMHKPCPILAETDDYTLCLYGTLDTARAVITFETDEISHIAEEIHSLYLVPNGNTGIVRIDMTRVETQTHECGTRPRGEFVDQIPDVLWKSGYQIGTGLDAITNIVHKSAVQVAESNIPEQPSNRTDHYAQIICDASEYATLLSTELSGRYTCQDFSVGGSFQYLNAVQYSEKSLSIIIRENISEIEYTGNYKFELTPEAKELAQTEEGRLQFRNTYGDYFISDFRKGAYFVAVYRCESQTIGELQKFKSSLPATSVLFDFSMDSAFQKLMQTYHIRLDVQIFCYGCTDMLPFQNVKDALDVGKALAWFKNHRKSVPVYANLMHYSTLPGYQLPKQIPYDAETLLNIKTLYAQLWHLESAAKNIPHTRAQLSDRVAALFDEAAMRLPELPTDQQLVTRLRNQVKSLADEVQEVLYLYKIYQYLKDIKSHEPKPFEKKKCTERTVWNYGCSDCPHVKTLSGYAKATGYGSGYHDKPMDFPIAEDSSTTNAVVIGYRLETHWTNGTGGDWWKLSDHGLLDRELHICISSYWGRGFDWEYQIYYVAKEYMDF